MVLTDERVQNTVEGSTGSLNFEVGMYFICRGDVMLLRHDEAYEEFML